MAVEWKIADLQVGDRFSSPGDILVTADDICAFAARYDPQPAHLSEETAVGSPLGGLAASGWQTAAITMRLLVEAGFMGMVGAGVTLSWPTPTRPGDRLRVTGEVVATRESRSIPGRGIVEIEYDTTNQAGEVRQHTKAIVVVWYENT